MRVSCRRHWQASQRLERPVVRRRERVGGGGFRAFRCADAQGSRQKRKRQEWMTRMHTSVNKDKLAAVEKNATGVDQAMLLRIGAEEIGFRRPGRAWQSQVLRP